VAIVRAVSRKRTRLLDNPNERSLHSTPKPRGGGIVVAVLVILALSFHLSTDGIGERKDFLFLLSLILVAGIGFLDDLFSISALLRLMVHFTAALIFCLSLPVFAIEGFFSPSLDNFFKLILLLSSVVWMAWSANAFNFMDGADGLAGLQSIVAGFGIVGIGHLLNDPLIMWIGGCIAATMAGFLFHNWNPAKIFLGDVGSSFIGFIFGAIPILVLNISDGDTIGLVPWIAIGIAWPFYFDSGITLIRRVLKGERVWLPHREHAYQRIILGGTSHSSVSVAYALLAMIPIVFIWVGIYFRSVFYLMVSLGLVFSTFGLFIYNAFSSKKPDQ
jgi:UDP-N-acetylmuramyl pentapeptide phosphotransferase/UDP-N-acetylglucosamine-1-phosphate transferase